MVADIEMNEQITIEKADNGFVMKALTKGNAPGRWKTERLSYEISRNAPKGIEMKRTACRMINDMIEIMNLNGHDDGMKLITQLEED